MRRSSSLASVGLVVAGVLLSACEGVAENDFIPEYERKYCRAVRRCSTDEMIATINVEECLEWFRIQPYPEPPDCKYDAKLAEQCLTELHLVGCDGPNPAFPESCADVYAGCRYPKLPRVDEPENAGF